MQKRGDGSDGDILELHRFMVRVLHRFLIIDWLHGVLMIDWLRMRWVFGSRSSLWRSRSIISTLPRLFIVHLISKLLYESLLLFSNIFKHNVSLFAQLTFCPDERLFARFL